MSSEPEHPIENLLRASAKKRREEAGAPLELHPATRRLLHGEVSRQFSKSRFAPKVSSPRFARLWPRFAWGIAAFAILSAVCLLLLPGGRKETTLAQMEQPDRL